MYNHNCFDGYLTPGCATCPDWADGTDDRGIGCACSFPIGECPHFAEMERNDPRNQHHCKYCISYDKTKHVCTITGKHTAKKNTCLEFNWF